MSWPWPWPAWAMARVIWDRTRLQKRIQGNPKGGPCCSKGSKREPKGSKRGAHGARWDPSGWRDERKTWFQAERRILLDVPHEMAGRLSSSERQAPILLPGHGPSLAPAVSQDASHLCGGVLGGEGVRANVSWSLKNTNLLGERHPERASVRSWGWNSR